jgi:ribosomal protein S27AE
MGERNCAYEGCNALEFRTSGFCLRHKEGSNPHEDSPIVGPSGNAETRHNPISTARSALAVMSGIIGFFIFFIGILMLPATNWFGPLPGLFVMGIGGFFLGGGYLITNLNSSSAILSTKCPDCGAMNMGTFETMQDRINCGNCNVDFSPGPLEKNH